MIISALVASTALLPIQDKPIELHRVFAKGEKASYKVLSHLQIQHRQGNLQTFMPSDQDYNYNFTTEVTQMKPDGIAVLRYQRPSVTEIMGETMTSGPRSRVIKMNMDFLITLSPINQILEFKDIYKKPAPKGKGGKGGKANWMAPASLAAPVQDPLMGFVQEIYRLSLFTGSFDSALDFSPVLPYDEIKVGDTWQHTVGYSPQSLKNSKGKSAVQRLDYTFVYKGVQQVNGKPFHRVSANLKLDTDMAPWIHDISGMKPMDTNLHAFKLKLDANIDYDLDMKTKRTVRAMATSDGGFQVFLTSNKDEAIVEQKINGKTTLSLVSVKQ